MHSGQRNHAMVFVETLVKFKVILEVWKILKLELLDMTSADNDSKRNIFVWYL